MGEGGGGSNGTEPASVRHTQPKRLTKKNNPEGGGGRGEARGEEGGGEEEDGGLGGGSNGTEPASVRHTQPLSQPERDCRRVGEHSPGSAHTEIELPRN